MYGKYELCLVLLAEPIKLTTYLWILVFLSLFMFMWHSEPIWPRFFPSAPQLAAKSALNATVNVQGQPACRIITANVWDIHISSNFTDCQPLCQHSKSLNGFVYCIPTWPIKKRFFDLGFRRIRYCIPNLPKGSFDLTFSVFVILWTYVRSKNNKDRECQHGQKTTEIYQEGVLVNKSKRSLLVLSS